MVRLTRRSLLGTTLAAGIAPGMNVAARQQTPTSAPWPDASWPRANPADLDIDPMLPELLTSAAQAAPSVTGVVVTRRGQVAADYWAAGWTAEDPIDIRSCTKSVVSALVGRARHDGLLTDLSVTVGDLIPERIPNGADAGVEGITLWSLLTMTSGLQWDWQTDYQRLEGSDDPVALTLGQPIIAPQGELYVYNSGGSHIIGLMVAAAAEMPLEAYAQKALFEPLAMTMHGWRRTPQGEVIGGYGLQLIPADMARLGYLYLRNGTWDGEQMIAPEYVSQSTRV